MAASMAALLLAASVAGCTPMQWVDMKTGSPEGAQAALDDCNSLARDEAWRGQWYRNWPPLFYEPYPYYHGWRRPSHRLAQQLYLLAWFEKYRVKDGDAKPPTE